MLEKPGRSRLDLPLIKFEKIIDKDDMLLFKNKIEKNRKSNYSNLSEYKRMNKTSIKNRNYNNTSNFNSDKNTNLMMTTSSKFSKFKKLKDKM